MKHAKKFIAGILTMTMIIGSVVTVNAAPEIEDSSYAEEEVVAADVFYESDAIKMTTNEKQGWTFDSPWKRDIELMPEYGGIEWPVMITCGYEEILWIKNDYITRVGGTAEGYKACGLVGNDGDTKYTSWMEPATVSGKITITHKGQVVTYGVKIHFGN